MVAIEVRNLGKMYRIGERESALRDLIPNIIRRILGGKRREREIIWALKDVSFDIGEGEVVGIIGKNGAGKTTLLKILSRITYPTEGIAIVRGKVGSLLEVGIGFHPELTGRENIFLSGAILGMRRREILRRFDEIVGFAGIEKFIDTPVKYYSSGMYMRLAFSVSAHLDTDILLVDEVLAVGDIEFQKKCLTKMGEISNLGKTVLFVSHNMHAIKNITQKCIYLKSGMIEDFGPTYRVLERYMKDTSRIEEDFLPPLEDFHRDGKKWIEKTPVFFVKVWCNNCEDKVARIKPGDEIEINMEIESKIKISGAFVGLSIKKIDGTMIGSAISVDDEFRIFCGPGRHTINVKIKNLYLPPGEYLISCGINQSEYTHSWDVILDYPAFKVELMDQIFLENRHWGAVWLKGLKWEIK